MKQRILSTAAGLRAAVKGRAWAYAVASIGYLLFAFLMADTTVHSWSTSRAAACLILACLSTFGSAAMTVQAIETFGHDWREARARRIMARAERLAHGGSMGADALRQMALIAADTGDHEEAECLRVAARMIDRREAEEQRQQALEELRTAAEVAKRFMARQHAAAHRYVRESA